MAARRLEAAAPVNEKQAFAALFFLHQFRASRSIDVGVSVSYPCKVIPLSDEHGLWDKIKKVKTKKKTLPMNKGENSWKPKQTCGAPRIDLELSWSKDRSRLARCSCVYFATQYNVHYDNRQAGHLLSALRLERCTAAIIFPHNKMAQKITECTFNLFPPSVPMWELDFFVIFFNRFLGENYIIWQACGWKKKTIRCTTTSESNSLRTIKKIDNHNLSVAEKGVLISIGWRKTNSFLVCLVFFSQHSNQGSQVDFCLGGKRLRRRDS